MKIEKTEYGIKFTLPELLPHKKVFDEGRNSFDVDNRNYFINLQFKAIDWKERYQIESFNSKILACFVHYYHGDDKLIDNDNRAFREFINSCINMVFVPTDNPEWLSFMCISIKDADDSFFSKNEDRELSGTSHTEVYVFDDLNKIIRKECHL